MLNIAIIEDSVSDTALIEGYIKKNDSSSRITTFESGESFLSTFCAMQYDLVFLDIYLNKLDGIEVAKIIRKTDKSVSIAFTTTSIDFTLDSYRVGALKYLEKPVMEEDVKEMLVLAQTRKNLRATFRFTLSGGKQTEIFLDSILFLEQQGHIICIHASYDTFYTSQSAKMDYMQETLPSPPFLRCHRSYIVNLDYVLKIDKEMQAFIMKNGDRVDIKRGNLKKCEDVLKLWILEKTKKSL